MAIAEAEFSAHVSLPVFKDQNGGFEDFDCVFFNGDLAFLVGREHFSRVEVHGPFRSVYISLLASADATSLGEGAVAFDSKALSSDELAEATSFEEAVIES